MTLTAAELRRIAQRSAKTWREFAAVDKEDGELITMGTAIARAEVWETVVELLDGVVAVRVDKHFVTTDDLIEEADLD
jgi:non-ribosomal peptide synthetase component F